MFYVYIVSGLTLIGIFILFLVISRTLNSIINHLTKIEFLVRQERDYAQELEEIKRMLAENSDVEE
jgi:Tfp pilus assembly protein PilN